MKSYQELYRCAEILAQTRGGLPKELEGNVPNVFLILLAGDRAGLGETQSLQWISLRQGKITMWGDALPALAQRHPQYEGIADSWDEKTKTATVTVTRAGREYTRTFSVAEAQRANLLRSPIWKSYPERMCMHRARGFVLRDAFADALLGFLPAEEVDDYQPLDAPSAPESSPPAPETQSPQPPAERSQELTQALDELVLVEKEGDVELLKLACRRSYDSFSASSEKEAIHNYYLEAEKRIQGRTTEWTARNGSQEP
jgi:hypothetical protein